MGSYCLVQHVFQDSWFWWAFAADRALLVVVLEHCSILRWCAGVQGGISDVVATAYFDDAVAVLEEGFRD